MLKRKIYDKLLQWKETSRGQSALLIDGARRVGKSYIAQAFAEREYRSYILIDFGNADQELLDVVFTRQAGSGSVFCKAGGVFWGGCCIRGNRW